MTKYILPFTEVQKGWWEIEADSLEEAKKLASDTDYLTDLECNYNTGDTFWDVDDLTEDQTN